MIQQEINLKILNHFINKCQLMQMILALLQKPIPLSSKISHQVSKANSKQSNQNLVLENRVLEKKQIKIKNKLQFKQIELLLKGKILINFFHKDKFESHQK